MARVPVQFFHDPIGGIGGGLLPPRLDGAVPTVTAQSLCCLASDGTVWRRVYPLGEQCRWVLAQAHPSGVPAIPPLPQPEPAPEDHPAADFEPGKLLRVRRDVVSDWQTARFERTAPYGGVVVSAPEGDEWEVTELNWRDPAG